MAAWHEREHQRAAAPVLSKGHRPQRAQRRGPGSRGDRPQQQAAKDPGLENTGRGSGPVPPNNSYRPCCDDHLNPPLLEPLLWCLYAAPITPGVQRWFCLSPTNFVDEPSDADRHEQDRDRVIPNGGHHRAEDVTEIWPARPNEIVNNIRWRQTALKAVDRIPQARAGVCDVLFEILNRLGHFETLFVKTSASRSSDSTVRFGASEVFAIALRP